MTRLQEIIGMMNALETMGDQESAHSNADDLLVDAVAALAEVTADTDIVAQTEELLESYERIEKWFA